MVTNFETYADLDEDQLLNFRDSTGISIARPVENPFQSFWMAGFECSDKLNAFGNRVDLLNDSGHLQLLEVDYCNISMLNMTTVREGIRWSQVEKLPYTYDWSAVIRMIDFGKRNSIQQVWDLCHFGFPDDLTPLHPMFARRFSALCRSFVKLYRSLDPSGVLIITPVNEVSFLSWLGGDAGGTSPYCNGQGWRVKYCLMKAYIEGVAAMKEIDDSIRILTTEPLINVVAPLDSGEEQAILAASLHEHQFQVTDMLCGRICPELGGRPDYLDIIGFNYYSNNQWITGSNKILGWANELQDERFVPLSQLFKLAHERYERPFVLSETSHPGEHRPQWIDMIAGECRIALIQGLPLWGVCWYPVTDRPDWDNLDHWHQSGIWDGAFTPGQMQRMLHGPTANALLKAQVLLEPYINTQSELKYSTAGARRA